MDPSTPLSIRVNIGAPNNSSWTPNSPVVTPRGSGKMLRHKYGHVNPARFQADAANSVQRHLQSCISEQRGTGSNMSSTMYLDPRMSVHGGGNANHEQSYVTGPEFPRLEYEVDHDPRKRVLETQPSFQREPSVQGIVTSESGRKRRRTGDFSGPSTVSNVVSPRIHAHRLGLHGLDSATNTSQGSQSPIPGSETRNTQGPMFIRSNPATPTLRQTNIHSSAALFRRSSSTAKKQTRPAMAKLFGSLELSPEEFVDLQAAAKAFMLDPSYPERRDCVGSKGGGDVDRVRLRLYNCVREFLNSEGSPGERFFGYSSLSGTTRKHIWPRDEVEVIEICTPLLRRMVTNERQRRYALESRQNTGRSRLSGGLESVITSDETTNETEQAQSFQDHELHRTDKPVDKGISLRLIILKTRNGIQEIVSQSSHVFAVSGGPSPISRLAGLVNFVNAQAQQGAWPKVDQVEERHGATFLRVLSPVSGLQHIRTDGELERVIADVQDNVWMEGELRVVAEVLL